MARITRDELSRQHLRSLRGYVLSPVTDALERVEREQSELLSERRAFETFVERVKALDTESVTSNDSVIRADSSSDGTERVRTAYRETVMAVDHYEQAYDEALLENVTMELGPGIAHALSPKTQTAVTESFKRLLVLSARESVTERTEVLADLGTEHDSLVEARDELTCLVGSLESTRIPSWYRSDFRERCDALASERQATLEKNGPAVGESSHGLYEYLYRAEPWTYPVLTAVTRLCESVVTR